MDPKLIGDGKNYSERTFWKKVHKYVRKVGRVGRKLLEKVFCLYYAAKDPKVPAWAKTAVIGALGYFINPFDAIPDFVPVGGFTDDLGVVMSALALVAMHITPKIKKKAAKKVSDLFD